MSHFLAKLLASRILILLLILFLVDELRIKTFYRVAGGTIYPYYTPGASEYIFTVAGNGQNPSPVNLSTALSTSIPLNEPQGLFVTLAGDIYVADTANLVIRFINATTGMMNVVAGNGQSFSSDNVNPLYSGIGRPTSVWVGESVAYSGISFYFVDLNNNLIRQVTEGNAPKVTTIIGTGASSCGSYSLSNNNQDALSTVLCRPVYVVGDAVGNLYFTEIGSTFNFIRKLTKATNIVTVIAGTGGNGYSGNNLPPLSTTLNEATALWYDNVHDLLYFVDRYNFLIRCINFTSNIVINIAGVPQTYSSPDSDANVNNGTHYALSTTINRPNGVWGDGNGSIYFTNTQDFLVQKVELSTGIIQNVIGTTKPGYSNNVSPLQASLGQPWYVFVRNSFVYVTCETTNYVQVVYPRIYIPTAQPTAAPIQIIFEDASNTASFDNVQTPVLASALVAVTCALFASFFANHRNKINKKVVTDIKSIVMLCLSMMIFGWSFISFLLLIYVCLENKYTHAAGYWLIILRFLSIAVSIHILYSTMSRAKAKPKKKSKQSSKKSTDVMAPASTNQYEAERNDSMAMSVRQDSDQVQYSTDVVNKDMVFFPNLATPPAATENMNEQNRSSTMNSAGRYEEAEPGYYYISYSNVFGSKQLYGLFMVLIILNITFVRYLPWYRSRATEKLDGFPSLGVYMKAQSSAIVYSLGLLITQSVLVHIRVVQYHDLNTTFSLTTLLCSLVSNAILLVGHIVEIVTIFHLIYQEYVSSIEKPRRKKKRSKRNNKKGRRRKHRGDDSSLEDDDSCSSSDDSSDSDSTRNGGSSSNSEKSRKKKGKVKLSDFMLSTFTATDEDLIQDAINNGGEGNAGYTEDIDERSEGEVESIAGSDSTIDDEQGGEGEAQSPANEIDVENPVHQIVVSDQTNLDNKLGAT